MLPAAVPTVTATGRGALVTVVPATRAPGEARIVMDSDASAACELCAGGLEFFGPLPDAELRIGDVMDDAINRLPRPEQLWYGGMALSEGRYAFAHFLVEGPDEPYILIGIGILTVSSGPTPAVAVRTPGDAPLFVGVERLVFVLHGAALGLVVFRRPRIARLAGIQRGLAAAGLGALGSLALAGGLGFYVSLAGSPF